MMTAHIYEFMTSPIYEYGDLKFSLNRYDDQGKIIEKGIYLHFDNAIIRITEEVDLDLYDQFVESLDYMSSEIEDAMKQRNL